MRTHIYSTVGTLLTSLSFLGEVVSLLELSFPGLRPQIPQGLQPAPPAMLGIFLLPSFLPEVGLLGRTFQARVAVVSGACLVTLHHSNPVISRELHT